MKQKKLGKSVTNNTEKYVNLHKIAAMKSKLVEYVKRYHFLEIDRQQDYAKRNLYSIIFHSAAMDGSTITELQNETLLDGGSLPYTKSRNERQMNLGLKAAYDQVIALADEHAEITVARLTELASLVDPSITMRKDAEPQLTKFCREIDRKRRQSANKKIQKLYELSFDAHFGIFRIFPFSDGNGRMARLLMNWLQFEFALVPTKVMAEEKGDYISAIYESTQSGDLNIFRRFMTMTMKRHLAEEIGQYIKAVGYLPGEGMTPAEKIIELLRENPHHSTKTLSENIGMSLKGIEKQLIKLKQRDKIRHVGTARNGYWEVLV